MVTQTITLSMIPGGVTPRIYASQNDHGLRVFVFNLVDENGGYAIPSGTTALLNVLKPDRTVVSETCTWSGSTVTADCTEQMTAVAGNVHCEVRLVAANGDAVGSANFILGVESNPLASGVVSESDFDSISDMVDRAVAAASIPPTYVTDWLDENITQETGYVIDKSLTIENAAADAKAAGDLIRASFVVGEASGSIASFTDGADGVPVKDLVVNINPIQSGSGDPSPTNVRAISGYTEANIYRTGKNLLEYNITAGTYSGLTCTLINDNGGTTGVTLNGTSTGSPAAIRLGYLKKSGNLKVVISATPSTSGSFRFTIEANKNGSNSYLNTTWYYPNNGKQTFDINVADGYDTYRLVLWIGNGYSASNLAVNVMVVDSNETDDTFEPYNGNTYNVSFGTAGTVYGGTLDVTSGMLTVTHGRVDLGTLPWYYSSAYTMFFAAFSEAKANAATGWADSYNYIGAKTDSAMGSAADYTIACGPGAGYVKVKDSRYTVNTDFKTAVTGKYYVYELANPVSVQLDATTIKTLLGNNNIFADTGSVASCEYRADTKLYIEKLTTPDNDMIADSNITSGSYFMVNNNLYLATANIANGGAITPGTNCTATNLAAALNAINS